MFLRHTLLAAILAAGASAAQSQTVFTDNFDNDTLGANVTSFTGGWTVTDGTVDVVGPGYFDFLPGHGRYVDLDGSTRDAGVFTKTLTLTGGTTYTASFLLAGSQRNFTEIVDVSFGTTTATYTFAPTDPFGTKSLTFTPLSTGSVSLSFANRGGDLEGALLDNVTITAVPEPETYALMLAGLLVVGSIARRCRSNG